MIITPTYAGSAIAGAGVGVFAWSLALKAPDIPVVKQLYTGQRKEQLFAWANGNRGMALLALEALNFGVHGITSADAVIFALGNSVVNVAGLWLFLPLRQHLSRRRRTNAVLRGGRVA